MSLLELDDDLDHEAQVLLGLALAAEGRCVSCGAVRGRCKEGCVSFEPPPEDGDGVRREP